MNMTIAWLQIITGIGILLFWIAFFTIGLAPENPPAGFFVYEHAFPLPDSVLSIALIFAGLGLLQHKNFAVKLTYVTGGALIFLGLVDFSFNFQNGMYQLSTTDLFLNAFINFWSVGFGLFSIIKLR